MTKFFSMILAALLAFSMTACGGGNPPPESAAPPAKIDAASSAKINASPAAESDSVEELQQALEIVESATGDLLEVIGGEDTESAPAPAPESEPSEPAEAGSDDIRPDFKAAMDSYEAFYDEYCQFVKEYEKNPSDVEMLAQYGEMTARLLDVQEKFIAWESEDMTDAELLYYSEVNLRISQKLLEAAH